MDFFKKAASLAQNSKSDESDSKSGDGGFDFNKMSNMLGSAQGFLAETDDTKKPETAAEIPEPVPEIKHASEEEKEPETAAEIPEPVPVNKHASEEEKQSETAAEIPEPVSENKHASEEEKQSETAAEILEPVSENKHASEEEKQSETAAEIPESVPENKHASEEEKVDAQEKLPAADSSSSSPALSADHPNTTTASPTSDSDTKPSYSELYGSAQTLYSGLRGKLEGKNDIDDEKLKGAAEDLLEGAESAGLLKPDNPYGNYFKKAEGFLYNSSAEPNDSDPKKDTSDSKESSA